MSEGSHSSSRGQGGMRGFGLIDDMGREEEINVIFLLQT